MKHANAERLRRRGFGDAEARAAVAALSEVDDFARGRLSQAALQGRLDDAWREPWAEHTNLPRTPPDLHELATSIRWRNLDLDPAEAWKGVRSPVLLIFGEGDEAVPVERSRKAIVEALRLGGNSDVEVTVFPRAGHELRPAGSPFTAHLVGEVQDRCRPQSGSVGIETRGPLRVEAV